MKRLCRWIMSWFKEEPINDRPTNEDIDTDKPDDGLEVEEARKELWYPKAIKTEGKQRTRGYYKHGYPQGAVVHFTAGRSRNKEEGGKRQADTHYEQGLRSVKHSVDKGAYTYFLISRDGTVFQNFPLNRWGYHAGKSYLPGLSGSVSDKLVGIEVMNAGKLEKKGDVYHAWFTTTSKGDKPFYKHEVRYFSGSKNQAKGYYHKYSPEQEKALKELLLWLKHNNPEVFSLEKVVGHDEVSPGRKSDPGGSLSVAMKDYRRILLQEYEDKYGE